MDIDSLSENIILLIGEKSQNLVSWGKTFDASYSYTEGQFRALNLRIRRLLLNSDFKYDEVFEIGENEDVIILENKITERIILVAVIIRTKTHQFNETIVEIVKGVASRAGIYTAKKMHSEIIDALVRHETESYSDVVMEEFTAQEAQIFLETRDLTNKSKELLSILINSLTSQDVKLNYLHSKHVFNATLLMLAKIKPEDDPDMILDSAYLMASNYKNAAQFYYATQVFTRIGDRAIKIERLGLEISCRIQQADIIKIQEDLDPSEIVNTLINIDDGSMEVASPYDREVFYCLHGYAYDKMEDEQSAEDYYLMATMVAEMEGANSIYMADAHAFIGNMHFKRFEVDNAIREFITASSIAIGNKHYDQAKVYSHQAGISELVWSKMYASSAIINRMDGSAVDADFYAWKSLNHLLKGIGYTNREIRKAELESYYKEIIQMCEEILTRSYDEYTINTIELLKNNFAVLSEGELPEEEEVELLKFLTTAVSAKLPLPDPVIMIIANDGRFITGGKINSDDWSDSALGSNDDLFSGALSAIMAILSEVISTSNPLRMVDAGTTGIMIERSSNCIGALLIDRDVHILRRALKDVLMKIDIKYPGLEDWDGYSINFEDMPKLIYDRFKLALIDLAKG